MVTFILRLLWNKQDVALIAKAGFRLLGGMRTFHSKRAQCLCFIDVNLFETGFFSKRKKVISGKRAKVKS